MKAWIDRKFGTWRGLVRLLLAYAELASGRLYAFRLRRPGHVERLVYVSSSMVFERAEVFPTPEDHLPDCPTPR